MLAVYLTSIKPKDDIKLSKAIYLPILLFLGSGVIDTSIKYLETTYVDSNGIPVRVGELLFYLFFVESA